MLMIVQLEKEVIQGKAIDCNKKNREWYLDTAITKGKLMKGTNVNHIETSFILHSLDLRNSLLQDTSMAGISRLNIINKCTF